MLQISDLHIAREGQLVSDRLDTAASLERLVTRIAEILPAIEPLDAILISGDLSDDGSAESYRLLRQSLARLDVPLFAIPGNHDLREPMRAAFAAEGYLPSLGGLHWARQLGDIELIGLDTLVEGQGGGALDAAALDFLEHALEASGERPVLLALHHPPFASGIAFMDRIGLSGIDGLEKILARSPSEIRIICGHIHSTMVATVAGRVALSAPSPCSSFAFDRRPDAPVGYHISEDGMLLHTWHGAFRSVRIPICAGAGPYPF
ncbi:phosphodiesterase [Pelagivirga sediminicola]|uniref:phosphodiesterase n=1 Tax=Pelagivirga sediminicola TaxID=2170575 RepID=UPI00311AA701